MTMKKIYVLWALTLLSVTAVAQGLPQDPTVRKGQLKNGMSVPKGVDPMHPQRVSRRAMRGR